MRQHLLEGFLAFAGRADIEIVCNQCGRVRPVPAGYFKPVEYFKVLRASQFCLVLGGDTVSSKRDLEPANFGCIPVYVGRSLKTLPYPDDIAYQDFAIFMPSNSTATSILQVLDNMTSREQDLRRQAMKAAVVKLNLRTTEGITLAAQQICKAAKR